MHVFDMTSFIFPKSTILISNYNLDTLYEKKLMVIINIES